MTLTSQHWLRAALDAEELAFRSPAAERFPASGAAFTRVLFAMGADPTCTSVILATPGTRAPVPVSGLWMVTRIGCALTATGCGHARSGLVPGGSLAPRQLGPYSPTSRSPASPGSRALDAMWPAHSLPSMYVASGAGSSGVWRKMVRTFSRRRCWSDGWMKQDLSSALHSSLRRIALVTPGALSDKTESFSSPAKTEGTASWILPLVASDLSF